jgi:hypothetical protein
MFIKYISFQITALLQAINETKELRSPKKIIQWYQGAWEDVSKKLE